MPNNSPFNASTGGALVHVPRLQTDAFWGQNARPSIKNGIPEEFVIGRPSSNPLKALPPSSTPVFNPDPSYRPSPPINRNPVTQSSSFDPVRLLKGNGVNLLRGFVAGAAAQEGQRLLDQADDRATSAIAKLIGKPGAEALVTGKQFLGRRFAPETYIGSGTVPGMGNTPLEKTFNKALKNFFGTPANAQTAGGFKLPPGTPRPNNIPFYDPPELPPLNPSIPGNSPSGSPNNNPFNSGGIMDDGSFKLPPLPWVSPPTGANPVGGNPPSPGSGNLGDGTTPKPGDGSFDLPESPQPTTFKFCVEYDSIIWNNDNTPPYQTAIARVDENIRTSGSTERYGFPGSVKWKITADGFSELEDSVNGQLIKTQVPRFKIQFSLEWKTVNGETKTEENFGTALDNFSARPISFRVIDLLGTNNPGPISVPSDPGTPSSVPGTPGNFQNPPIGLLFPEAPPSFSPVAPNPPNLQPLPPIAPPNNDDDQVPRIPPTPGLPLIAPIAPPKPGNPEIVSPINQPITKAPNQVLPQSNLTNAPGSNTKTPTAPSTPTTPSNPPSNTPSNPGSPVNPMTSIGALGVLNAGKQLLPNGFVSGSPLSPTGTPSKNAQDQDKAAKNPDPAFVPQPDRCQLDPCMADLQRKADEGSNKNKMVTVEARRFLRWDRLFGAQYVPERIQVPADLAPLATTLLNRQAEERSRFGLAEIRAKFMQMLNILGAVASLHNAAMLSTNVGQTIGDMITSAVNQFGDNFGLDKDTAESFNFNEVMGKAIEDQLKSILGADTYNGAKQSFLKANRIIQTASNLYYTMHSIADSARSIMEMAAENTGRIGNALKRFRVIGENAFPWMPENVNGATARQAKIDRVINGLENVENTTSTLSSITSDIISIDQEIQQVKEQREEFDKALKEFTPKTAKENIPIKTTEAAAKAASVSPDISAEDREKASGVI